jgi:hypothetical protein
MNARERAGLHSKDKRKRALTGALFLCLRGDELMGDESTRMKWLLKDSSAHEISSK